MEAYRFSSVFTGRAGRQRIGKLEAKGKKTLSPPGTGLSAPDRMHGKNSLPRAKRTAFVAFLKTRIPQSIRVCPHEPRRRIIVGPPDVFTTLRRTKAFGVSVGRSYCFSMEW